MYVQETIRMTKSYKVAEHIFNLTLPEGSVLWEHLGQYEPFLQEQVCTTPLFSLEVGAQMPEGELTPVLLPETEDGETVIKLYHIGEDWWFEASPDHRIPTVAKTWASKDFRQGRLEIVSRKISSAVFGINNALMLLYAFNTATLGTLEMHASMVSNSGKAFLFIAKSGTGKSTHSQQWLNYIPGTELMNDDNPVVRVEGDKATIYGSPWSGKTPCYRNIQAPIGAFIRIKQRPENAIRSLETLEAFIELLSAMSNMKWDRRVYNGICTGITELLRLCPIYELGCLPDAAAAHLCHDTVLR